MLLTIVIVSIIALALFVYLSQRVRSKQLNRETNFYELLSKNILEAIPDLIVVVDRDYKILLIANSTEENSLFPSRMKEGYHVMETIEPCMFISPEEKTPLNPEENIPILESIKKAFDSDEVVETEYVVSMNGKLVYFEGRYKKIDDSRVLCVERNITKHKEAEENLKQQNQFFDVVMDSLPVPIYIKDIDDDFKYVYWNKECEEYGPKKADVLGKTDLEIFGEEWGNVYRETDIETVETGELYHHQNEFEDVHGRKCVTIDYKKVVKRNKKNLLLNIRWDITGLLEAQGQLQEANQQLELALSITSSVPLIWDMEEDLMRFRFLEFKETNEGFRMDRDGLPSAVTVSNVHPDEREDLAEALRKLREGTSETLHKVVRYDINAKYESYYEVFIVTSKRNENGKPIQAVGAMRNITQSRLHEKRLTEANESIARIQNINQIILDNANSGLVYITPDYKIHWENLKKYSQEEFAQKYTVGTICYKGVRDRNEPCEYCVAQKAFETGEVAKGEITFDHDNTMAITATPVFNKDGSKQGVVLKFDDITAQRKAARELKEAKEAAETSDKLKSQFISNMSHEIRTPLNSIVGFSELLMGAKTDEERQGFMSVIKSNNELLLQLINDIIDLSKMEANILEFEYGNVEINEVIGHVVYSANRKIESGKNLGVCFNPPSEKCAIMTERNRLRQVFTNLVGNALKFTKEGIIEVGYEIHEKDMYFYVSDTGIGIPKDKQKDIFERFIKLNNFIAGTGLGLSICQAIVRKMGGEMGVESEEGKGSKFWFTLPVQPGTNMAENLTITQKRKLKEKVLTDSGEVRKSVLLIAEDSPENYKIYKNTLQDEYDLIHAWDGKETIELYEKHKDDIDVILMDIKMPVLNGFEATAIIRKTDLNIPIIAISAYVSPEDLEKIINSGFDNFIPKPVSRDDLFSVLRMFR